MEGKEERADCAPPRGQTVASAAAKYKRLEGGIEFHAYDGLPHSASAEEIDELKAFLAKVIPAQE